MKEKKLLAVIGIMISMALLMAGCGGGEDQQNASDEIVGTVAFETTDLEGNSVSSEEIFSENEITMINAWGTYCGPCINEMPELEELRREYEDKGIGILGVVVDVPDGSDEFVRDAESIIDYTGVKYPNVKSWKGIDDQLDLSLIPTTYFVDSQGKILAEPIVGAMVDIYRKSLDQLIK